MQRGQDSAQESRTSVHDIKLKPWFCVATWSGWFYLTVAAETREWMVLCSHVVWLVISDSSSNA